MGDQETMGQFGATLLGFSSGARCVHAKVGEKPKDLGPPPEGFFDDPPNDEVETLE